MGNYRIEITDSSGMNFWGYFLVDLAFAAIAIVVIVASGGTAIGALVAMAAFTKGDF